MIFKPSKLPILEQYPELRKYPEFAKGQDKQIKYVMYLTDPSEDNPYYQITDFELRVLESAKAAGYEDITDYDIDLLCGKDEVIANMINRMFLMFNSIEYEQWFTLKFNFYVINKSLRTIPEYKMTKDLLSETKHRTQIQTELNSLAKELLQIESRLFDNEAIRQAVSRIAAVKIGHYAEQFAKDVPPYME